ncbi:hypothetical protein [Rhizobium etli]|uniref:hypothetical protein n=1 Tax=Rhizobium etli TaxID=29449 RepID=UPI0012DB2858
MNNSYPERNRTDFRFFDGIDLHPAMDQALASLSAPLRLRAAKERGEMSAHRAQRGIPLSYDDILPKGAATWKASRHGLAPKEGRGESLAARAAGDVAFQSAAFNAVGGFNYQSDKKVPLPVCNGGRATSKQPNNAAKLPMTLAIDPCWRGSTESAGITATNLAASIHDLHIFIPKVVDGINRLLGGPACTERGGNQAHFGFLLKFQIKPFERLSCCDDMFIVERNSWNSI